MFLFNWITLCLFVFGVIAFAVCAGVLLACKFIESKTDEPWK